MKEKMLEFIKKFDNRVFNVKSVTLKDWDDEDGFIHEHYIVTCDLEVVDESSPSMVNKHVVQDCLVNASEFNAYMKKSETVKWL